MEEWLSLEHTNSVYETGYWMVHTPSIQTISHHRHGKEWKAEESQEKQACCDSYSLHYFWFWVAILSVKKEKANQYCHSQLQIKLSLLLLPPCSFLGHSICRNSDKRISIDCWWDQRINKWSGFFFSPPFVSSSKMDREWSNGAKHIKRRQSSTNTIKPWSRNYFPRRGSIAVQMFLQFSRQSPQTTKCP